MRTYVSRTPEMTSNYDVYEVDNGQKTLPKQLSYYIQQSLESKNTLDTLILRGVLQNLAKICIKSVYHELLEDFARI